MNSAESPHFSTAAASKRIQRRAFHISFIHSLRSPCFEGGGGLTRAEHRRSQALKEDMLDELDIHGI